MIVDVIRCATCLEPLRRTVRMVKHGTRHHAGACAAAASRETLWQHGQLDAHMRKMRQAASETRRQRLLRRLARIAPTVPPQLAQRLYGLGYKAGHQAKRRDESGGSD